MITGFEDHTHELSDDEKLLLPIMLQAFSHKTVTNPVKAPEIVKKMNEYIASKGYKIRMTETRLRKFVNYIRSNSLLPLIADSKGYYVSYERRILEMQLKSLEERANSILSARNGLVAFTSESELTAQPGTKSDRNQQ